MNKRPWRRTESARPAWNDKHAYLQRPARPWHRAAAEGTDEAAKAFASWQMRGGLAGPKAIREAIARIVETNDDHPARELAYEAMKAAVRADLQIPRWTSRRLDFRRACCAVLPAHQSPSTPFH